MYGLSLALTALNLARHSLTRPRVHVNIFLTSTLKKLFTISAFSLRRRSTFYWRLVSAFLGRDCRNSCNAGVFWPPPGLPTSPMLTENLVGWLATMVASSSSTRPGLWILLKLAGVSPHLHPPCNRWLRLYEPSETPSCSRPSTPSTAPPQEAS